MEKVNSFQKVTKEEAQRLLKIPGNVKGAVILANLEYLRRHKGVEGEELLKQRLKELGVDVLPDKVRPMDLYPEGYSFSNSFIRLFNSIIFISLPTVSLWNLSNSSILF